VAVPETTHVIALLDFSARAIQPEQRQDLDEMCDSMSGTFSFRWAEEQADAPVPEEGLREFVERQASETGRAITARTPDGRTLFASGRPRPPVRPGEGPNPFVEERYGWRRAGWSSGRPWQATDLEARVAAVPGGTQPQARAMIILFVVYAVIALTAAPGASKAPVVLLGVGILIGVIKNYAERGWTAVLIAGAALAAVLVLVVGLGR
jgi:hypothetical protein